MKKLLKGMIATGVVCATLVVCVLGGMPETGFVSAAESTTDENAAVEKTGFVIENGVLTEYDDAYGTTVTIPDSVTAIADYAFNGSRVVSVTIPAGVTSIGKRAFSGCGSLKTIVVAPGNKNFSSYKGVLYNKKKTTVLKVPAKKSTVKFHKKVTTIGAYSFEECVKIKKITIPSGVKRIENYAFSGCVKLHKVTIPASVKKIGKNSFAGCSGGNVKSSYNFYGTLITLEKGKCLNIYCPAGSYAEKYASKNKIFCVAE